MDRSSDAVRILGPKVPDRRHYSYDESADEPASLIESEAADVERETPADNTEPVQRIEDRDDAAPDAFEE